MVSLLHEASPVQELSPCHKLSDKVDFARRDIDSIQADTVGMLHLHKATVCYAAKIDMLNTATDQLKCGLVA